MKLGRQPPSWLILKSQLKVNSLIIGPILTSAIFAELLLFYISKRALAFLSVTTMLTIATLSSLIRWGILALFHSDTAFMVTQSLHGFTFALTHLAFMTFVNTSLPKAQIPSAHGLYASLAMSFSTGLFTLISSFFFEQSAQLAFLIMALAVVPCFLLIYLFHNIPYGKQQQHMAS